ncbi:hypothetical protein L6164_016896 [Bauhinia variegata]|uniref:Uncharacterized protein n=1 Tax=Bauhinia variegata TaxID=167791 RepID=A0ACB9N7S3_BAUVA|nr:hypothetical protein L6164_016896 [Bauhinia variegata]
MAGKLQLGFPKTSASTLREQAARKILRNVRSQGHPYVELREDGKKFIYFCTLCLAPCYGDTVLFDHLKGNLHAERLSAAKATLLKPNPWPFNDGVLFFDNSAENDDLEITNGNQKRLLLEYNDNDSCCNNSNLAIVKFGENLNTLESRCAEVNEIQCSSDIHLSSTGDMLNGDCILTIPRVLIRGEICDIIVRGIGSGKIAARFFEKDEISNGIRRIWCEWLGKGDNGLEIPGHDFGLVIFSYNYDMGRTGLLDDVKSLVQYAPATESENEGNSGQKRKKSLSDPEDISDSLSNQYDSSMEESSASSSATSDLKLDQYDKQLLHTRFISNKALRKELRRKQRLAAEKMCDICQQKMLPGKDVAALLNMKTGRLGCSSRNGTGRFHVFHTSCLVHWILLVEYETFTNSLVVPKVRRGAKRKVRANVNEVGKEAQMDSVFCPECQGTGKIMEGEELENTRFTLSQMFKFKIKACDGRREWMRSPEVLKNCSTGFHFPPKSDETVQERVEPIKLLHFFRAELGQAQQPLNPSN